MLTGGWSDCQRSPKELVRLKLDIIVTDTAASARAAKKATLTIPIVMVSAGNPVQSGLVASLARPEGNVTGLTSITSELLGKRLELLKEVLPKVLNSRSSTTMTLSISLRLNMP